MFRHKKTTYKARGRQCRRLLVALLVLLPPAARAGADSPAVIPGDAELEAAGAVIGQIVIDNRNVFSAPETEDRPVRLFADRIHTRTRESVIRGELLFREGARYSHRLLEESARLLRKKPYLFDASITKVAYHDGRVDLKVTTKDVWTLFPSFNFARAGGSDSSGAGLQDLNVLGSGAAVGIARTRNVDRTQTQLNVSDSNLAGTRVLANAAYSDNSDGSSRSFDLERPFYALDSRWATGASASDYTQTDSLYDRGAIIDQFREHERTLHAYGGWSPGLQNGWVERFTLGLTNDDTRFATVPQAIGPSLLPPERKLVYPWLQFDLLQDDYIMLVNHDQIGRTEDFHLGTRISMQFGFAEPAFGSDRHAVIVTGSGSYGVQPLPSETLLLSTSFNARIEAGTLRNGLIDTRVRWYLEESQHWLSYAAADETVGHSLDLDNQILLGGDSGLRGYPLRYQDGTSRLLATVEQRYFSDLCLFRTLRLGGAVFADSGRAWGDPPLAAPNRGFLSDVGVGLRLGSGTFGNVTHVDLAFPLNASASLAKVQLLVQIAARF
jgi:Surface antigen variable number repeat